MHGGEIMNFQISLLQIVSGGSGFVGSGDLGYFGMVRNIASHLFTSFTCESLIFPFFHPPAFAAIAGLRDVWNYLLTARAGHALVQ